MRLLSLGDFIYHDGIVRGADGPARFLIFLDRGERKNWKGGGGGGEIFWRIGKGKKTGGPAEALLVFDS